jgi:hypothetical protein
MNTRRTMQAAEQHAGSTPTRARLESAMPCGAYSRITFYSQFQYCNGDAALFRPGLAEAELWLDVTPEQADALRAVPICPVRVVADVERDERGRIIRGTLKGLLGF